MLLLGVGPRLRSQSCQSKYCSFCQLQKSTSNVQLRLHMTSSEKSPQSSLKSHTLPELMHAPLLHRNRPGLFEHDAGAKNQ